MVLEKLSVLKYFWRCEELSSRYILEIKKKNSWNLLRYYSFVRPIGQSLSPNLLSNLQSQKSHF